MENNLILENAKLVFTNFEGREKPPYNRAGDRNICIDLTDMDPGFIDQLKAAGWNIYKSNNPEATVKVSLTVKIKFNHQYTQLNPKIYMLNDGTKDNVPILLTEESVGNLDYMQITGADVIIRPYNYDVGGRTGVAAYLDIAYIRVCPDIFAAKYESPYEAPYESTLDVEDVEDVEDVDLDKLAILLDIIAANPEKYGSKIDFEKLTNVLDMIKTE